MLLLTETSRKEARRSAFYTLWIRHLSPARQSKTNALLTEAAELTYDVGQGDVGHALQLVLDVPRQHRVAQVPGLDGALHQRHPSAAAPLPAARRERKEGGGGQEH